ncbi:MAG: hypothetical protein H6Q15_330 [Bacteroidetes bacterium]|nr:hypothetical protein [Bacteroidota bacterium]
MYLNRAIEEEILKGIENFPVTAIIGARQCGKSTLVKHILERYDSIYLDLERPSDLNKLSDAEWFLSSQKDKLICIDEIQRQPELFPLIRSLVDERQDNGRFVVLGSASRDLLKQSSETLAGRIIYKHLTPFLWQEIYKDTKLEDYFFRGGFPLSLLKKDEEISIQWRESFISTFLERDLLQWSGFTPITMRRLWQMLAHLNGQTVNYSSIASSLGASTPTIKNYIDLLEGTFMVDVVLPYVSNLGKRLVKAPKVYISDSGICASLLNLRSFAEVSGHPSFGSIWEQIVFSNLKGNFPNAEFYFYRTSAGAEMDFVMKYRNKIYAIECKASLSPIVSKGTYNAIEDIQPNQVFVCSPVEKGYMMNKDIEVVSLNELVEKIKK